MVPPPTLLRKQQEGSADSLHPIIEWIYAASEAAEEV
jgi:hypothetical protein